MPPSPKSNSRTAAARAASLLGGACAAALTSACWTAPAMAADAAPAGAAPASSSMIEEVVVTAQKRAENIQNVPLSIAAVSGKTLTANGVANVLDLPKMVPNLRLDTTSQASGVALRIRGMGAPSNTAIDPSVAPYVDGAYIPRPGAILTSFLDIDDVEVLRGPQGTLFGRNATVGAISLKSVAPSFARDSGEVSAEVGNYGDRKFEAIGNWAVNDDLAMRLAAFDSHTDGYVHNELDGHTYGRGDTGAGRFSIKYKPTDWLTWTGRVDYAHTTGDGVNLNQVDLATASGAQLAHFEALTHMTASELPGPSFDTWQREDNPSLDDHQLGVTSDLLWDAFDGFSFRLIDSYHGWRNAQTDGDVTFTSLDLLNRNATFGSDSQSHELQFLSPKDKLLGGRLDFVAGLYYFEETYSTTEVLDLGSQGCSYVYTVIGHAGLVPACQAQPQTDATDGIFHQRATSYAGYLQSNFKITDSLTLTLGGRYTQDNKSGQFIQLVNNPFFGPAYLHGSALRAPENTLLSQTDSHPSWRANLDWKIAPQVMAFVTYSTGYKSGGFNNNGGAVALTSATRTFSAETSTDIEIGLKSTFFDRRLLLNADLFQTNLDNFQDRSFNGFAFIVRNAGDVRARGAELEGTIKPIDHVKLDFGVDYLDSIFTSNTDAPGLPACTGAVGSCPTVQNLTGRPTTFAPKWTTDLGLEYDTPAFANGWTAQLRGTLNYSSKTYTTDDDNPQSITGGQVLLGARVNVLSPDHSWTFSLYGDNLTDQKYFTWKLSQPLDTLLGVRVPATGATLMRGFMGAPLTFGGRIAKTF